MAKIQLCHLNVYNHDVMKAFLFVVFALAIGCPAVAQSETVRVKQFNIKKGLLLEGYDVVSYFDGTPMEGTEKWRLKHRGITYLFSSARNYERFKASPEKYEPAYGGWCAYAMGETGEKVKVDPETFKILNGKLYLFYNFWGNNTLKDWNSNEQKLKETGDRNWSKSVQ
jgi:YHS domain-containing protein